MDKTPRKKRPRDPAQLAKAVFDEAIGEAPKTDPPQAKNPAAAELGRAVGIDLLRYEPDVHQEPPEKTLFWRGRTLHPSRNALPPGDHIGGKCAYSRG